MAARDVIVIGAGLAGLRCSARLAAAGRDVLLLEADDRVGGRQRTDAVDGFLLDRGFQVLNLAYPAVRRVVDLAALRLRRFPVAVRVRREHRTVELAHPLRHPARIPRTLASGLLSPKDAAALARWAVPVIVSPRTALARPDLALGEAWDRVGLRAPLRTEVLEPFLAGVIADDGGKTSDAFVRLLVRSFALGRPGVPEHGIAALPAQLAETARAAGAEIRLGRRVTRLHQRAGRIDVDVAGADTETAAAVVVAVGPDRVADLVDVRAPATKGLQTWWFAADAAPAASALLMVDGRRRGPVVNSVIMTHTAPSYAPPGQHLIEATCLLPTIGAPARESDVRRQLTEMWGVDAAGWRLLRRDDLAHALPAQPPPLRRRSPARVSDGVYLAGDHRDTASIQGALTSGERVAAAILRAESG